LLSIFNLYRYGAELYAICWHPAKPDVFISAAESGRVFVWDAKGTNLLRHGLAGFLARAVAVSNKPLVGLVYKLNSLYS
jgi:WD40 repeat protein